MFRQVTRSFTKVRAVPVRTNFTLPVLPYADTALEPHMSAETFSYHHKKHHQTYITNLNKIVSETPAYQNLSLEEVMLKAKAEGNKPVFNNAGQHYNHSFFWESMAAPSEANKPTAATIDLINKSFGSYDAFTEKFIATTVGQFGSGWGWLVYNPKTQNLEVVATHDADCPLTDGLTPILTCDVWEHAYYIDYRNVRPDFVKTFVNKLVNWSIVDQRINNAVKA